jgi:acetyl-CoA acetyltransferase
VSGWPWGSTAIVGIGQTEFSKNSGRSELRLAVEAITAALEEAGVPVEDVDGLVTYTMDNNGQQSVATALGLPGVTHFSSSLYGGGGSTSTVLQGALAIGAGLAEVVVVYRGMNERSEYRFGQPRAETRRGGYMSQVAAHGLLTPGHSASLGMARYMHDYGVVNEDFAPISVQSRAYAASNPAAYFFGQPITAEDHDTSRWIVEPVLRLLDCCMESDGAVALVMTSVDRARDLRQPPVVVYGGAQGMVRDEYTMMNYYRSDAGTLPSAAVAARKLWALTGLRPSDIQVASLYDHFSPWVMVQLEEFGFCQRGEGKDFIASGALALDGSLPTNTNGGQLGEAYIHGMNGIAESVRQARGTALHQVSNVERVLVTSGVGVPTGAIVLGPV